MFMCDFNNEMKTRKQAHFTPWSRWQQQRRERQRTMVSTRSPGQEDGVQSQLRPIQGKQAYLDARALAQPLASIQE